MTLTQIDHAIFSAINFDGGIVLDRIMWFFSEKIVWAPLYLLLLWLVGRKWGWKYSLLVLLAVVVGVAASDQICNFFKETFQMPRPNRVASLRESMHLVWDPFEGKHYIGGQYGTVSAHAATVVSLAWFSALTIRKKWYNWVIAVAVILICYSRIYLACHFPMDILLGAIVGTICGLSMFFLWKKFDKVLEKVYFCGRKSF